ncbi:hypothetical protein AAIR98_000185 [Elusimicrobium simillimum]|uniref:hypothetical protein n=1 Tax=Elusimicrobium simillimum TaxID=3143438 RepID=UPI003C702CCC
MKTLKYITLLTTLLISVQSFGQNNTDWKNYKMPLKSSQDLMENFKAVNDRIPHPKAQIKTVPKHELVRDVNPMLKNVFSVVTRRPMSGDESSDEQLVCQGLRISKRWVMMPVDCVFPEMKSAWISILKPSLENKSVKDAILPGGETLNNFVIFLESENYYHEQKFIDEDNEVKRQRRLNPGYAPDHVFYTPEDPDLVKVKIHALRDNSGKINQGGQIVLIEIPEYTEAMFQKKLAEKKQKYPNYDHDRFARTFFMGAAFVGSPMKDFKLFWDNGNNTANFKGHVLEALFVQNADVLGFKDSSYNEWFEVVGTQARYLVVNGKLHDGYWSAPLFYKDTFGGFLIKPQKPARVSHMEGGSPQAWLEEKYFQAKQGAKDILNIGENVLAEPLDNNTASFMKRAMGAEYNKLKWNNTIPQPSIR